MFQDKKDNVNSSFLSLCGCRSQNCVEPLALVTLGGVSSISLSSSSPSPSLGSPWGWRVWILVSLVILTLFLQLSVSQIKLWTCLSSHWTYEQPIKGSENRDKQQSHKLYKSLYRPLFKLVVPIFWSRSRKGLWSNFNRLQLRQINSNSDIFSFLFQNREHAHICNFMNFLSSISTTWLPV